MLEAIVAILVDGLALGMTLFMVASGFSLIFGLLRIPNFSHGSLFMLGAFLGYETFVRTNNFVLGLIVAAAAIGALGAIIERGLLRRYIGRELTLILLTIGLMLLLDRIVWLRWGDVIYWWSPEYFIGTIEVAGFLFYKYRLFLVGFGFALAILMHLFLKYSKLGIIVRAGLDDAEMVETLGIDVKRAFTFMFVIGCCLAGLGGACVVPWLSASSSLGQNYLLYAFAIVVIGGVGSFKGSFIASIIVGIAELFCMYFIPWFAEASIFIVMLIVLLLKPEGVVRT